MPTESSVKTENGVTRSSCAFFPKRATTLSACSTFANATALRTFCDLPDTDCETKDGLSQRAPSGLSLEHPLTISIEIANPLRTPCWRTMAPCRKALNVAAVGIHGEQAVGARKDNSGSV